MTGIRLAQLEQLTAALANADVFGGYPDATRVAVAHLTPGVDVEAALMADGVVASSAARMARVALEVLGPKPADPEHAVRSALADAVYYLEHPEQPIPANRVRQLRRLAGVQLVEAGMPFARGMEGSARAAAKWTDEELTQVDDAIANVVNKLLAASSEWDEPPGTFTADDIWRELGDGFLVTKGLAGRLNAARNRGMIVNTGRTIISGRDDEHGHGQRLTVWRPRLAEFDL